MGFKLFTVNSTYLVLNTEQIISIYVDGKTSSTVILCREGNKYVIDQDIHKVITELGIKDPNIVKEKKKMSINELSGNLP